MSQASLYPPTRRTFLGVQMILINNFPLPPPIGTQSSTPLYQIPLWTFICCTTLPHHFKHNNVLENPLKRC